MISYADRIGDRSQGRIHRTDTDKETRVHDIEIVELMRLAVLVQHGGLWVRAEPACPSLMSTSGDWDIGLHIDVARDQVLGMHAQMGQDRFQLIVQLLL